MTLSNTKRRLVLGAAACLVGLAGVASPALAIETGVGAAVTDDTKHDEKALGIIDAYIETLGGEEMIKSIESTKIVGTMEIPMAGMTGQMTMMSKVPGMVSMTMDLPGFGMTRSGFDGTVGWSSDPMTGPRLMTEEEVDTLKAQADPTIAMKYRDLYETIEYSGEVNFEGRKAHKITLIDEDGDQQIEFFDITSGLMVGQVSNQETPMGAIEVTTVMSEYKEFGGMQMPTKMVTSLGPQKMIMTITSAEINTVEDDAFELPSEIKALVEAEKDG